MLIYIEDSVLGETTALCCIVWTFMRISPTLCTVPCVSLCGLNSQWQTQACVICLMLPGMPGQLYGKPMGEGLWLLLCPFHEGQHAQGRSQCRMRGSSSTRLMVKSEVSLLSHSRSGNVLTEGLDAHWSQCILVQKVWRIRTDRGEELEMSRVRNGCVENAVNPRASVVHCYVKDERFEMPPYCLLMYGFTHACHILEGHRKDESWD